MRLRLGEPYIVHGCPHAAACRILDFSRQLIGPERYIFRSPGMGGPRIERPGAVLPGTPRRFLAESSSLLCRVGADGDVPDRWLGYTDDHGLAESCSWLSPLLFLRRIVPRLSRCPCGSPRGEGVRAAA